MTDALKCVACDHRGFLRGCGHRACGDHFTVDSCLNCARRRALELGLRMTEAAIQADARRAL